METVHATTSLMFLANLVRERGWTKYVSEIPVDCNLTADTSQALYKQVNVMGQCAGKPIHVVGTNGKFSKNLTIFAVVLANSFEFEFYSFARMFTKILRPLPHESPVVRAVRDEQARIIVPPPIIDVDGYRTMHVNVMLPEAKPITKEEYTRVMTLTFLHNQEVKRYAEDAVGLDRYEKCVNEASMLALKFPEAISEAMLRWGKLASEAEEKEMKTS